MHNLIIDIGNTKTKVAVFANGKPLMIDLKTDLQVDFLQALIQKYQTQHAIISNVGSAKPDVEKYLSKQLDLIVLTSETPVPFTNNYATPRTLGVDRMALAAAAVKMYPNINCLVIDCGTCITYDFVDSSGCYRGGAISPGLTMRLKAMHGFTAKLPLVEFEQPEHFLAPNTRQCLIAGAYYGIIHEINGFIHQYNQEFESVQTVLTGGDAPVLAKHFKNNIFAAENFLLFGLNVILEHNIK